MKTTCFCGKHIAVLEGNGTLQLFQDGEDYVSVKPAEDAVGSPLTVEMASCGTTFEAHWSKDKQRYTQLSKTREKGCA